MPFLTLISLQVFCCPVFHKNQYQSLSFLMLAPTKEYRSLFSIYLVCTHMGRNKKEEGIQIYSDLFLMIHDPKISDADNAVQLLSEGFFNFSQQYTFVGTSIYNEDLDNESEFRYH